MGEVSTDTVGSASRLNGCRFVVIVFLCIGGSKGGGGASGTLAPPGGPNYFIFMQFLAKSLQNNPTLGVGAPLRKILDPPLVS